MGIKITSNKPIHQCIEEQAKRTPDKIALVYHNSFLTYSELNNRATRLAGYLMENGVVAGSIVGIMANRSIYMIVGILAILKTGAAYLPIDDEIPKERIEYMLKDSNTKILLSESERVQKLGFYGKEIIMNNISNNHLKDPEIKVNTNSNSLAYVIYTSGSTGNPKGAMVQHKSVVNLFNGITEKINFSSEKSILALTTLSFDIFVVETLLPLSKGLKVVIASKEQQKNPRALRGLISKHNITMVQATPSHFQLIIRDDNSIILLKNLTEIMIGGEQLSESLLKKIKKYTKSRIYNMYGPTETTVWSSLKELTDEEIISIGKPIMNTEMYIIDKNSNLLPDGEIGELCISGEGLALGYINNNKLTEEKFVRNLFNIGDRVYKTGDLAKRIPNGDIILLGRMDQQVKIRGHRVEPGEVEQALHKHDLISQAVVIGVSNSKGYYSLHAFIVSNSKISVSIIREFLSPLLPSFMIPTYYYHLSKIPMNHNGKADRVKLQKMCKTNIH
jgi:amino acid adenylation domain-containing protein